MYKIKQIPEDFVVNEVIDIKPKENGGYSYFILKKYDYATPAAVEKIAKFLNIKLKKIGYAGVKDRRAVTTQWISIEGDEKRAKNFNFKGIELEYKGKGDGALYLGRLKGNKFEIIVRNIKKKPKKITKFINYFDSQRFSMNNTKIGKALIKKDFKKAVEILMQSNGYYEKQLGEYYQKTGDAVNSLRKIPFHILLFFIHAYQSELWNKYAGKVKSNNIPIVGFGTETKNKAILDVMKKENITFRDFIIKSFPELSSEGNIRKKYAKVKNLQIDKLEDDELNKGMKKVKIKFYLDKGCYATMALRNMF